MEVCECMPFFFVWVVVVVSQEGSVLLKLETRSLQMLLHK